MYPSKKGLAIFIGILGVACLIIGGALLYLAADFIPWPECPAGSVYQEDGIQEDVYFLYKYSYTYISFLSNPPETAVKWVCVYKHNEGSYQINSREAHGRTHFEFKSSIKYLPSSGDQISMYLYFDLMGRLVYRESGDFGTLPMDAFHIIGYADDLDLSSLGYGPYVPAAIVQGDKGYHYLLMPDGQIAQYYIAGSNNTSM